jgi:hypothetical protein
VLVVSGIWVGKFFLIQIKFLIYEALAHKICVSNKKIFASILCNVGFLDVREEVSEIHE